MTEAMADGAIGRVIDRYRLDAPLGSGGFGVVYRATHLVTGRAVALKLLRPEHLGSRELLDRFVREARAAAAIEHPAIVDVLDAGTTPDGEAFLAMELLDGETLEERLAREPTLPTDQALALALGILEGLAAAHGRGVVHRDLKPANVFLPRPGTTASAVKLLDFGISKVQSATAPSLTRSGMILGTPHFMAPEQLSGSPTIDGRADLFAASVLFYVTLTGEHPFATKGDDLSSLLVRVHTEPPKPLADLAPWLPAGLRHVIERGLARDPDGRWPSASEYAKAMRAMSIAGTAEMAARMALRSTTPSGPGVRPPPPDAPTPQGDPFAATIATGQPTPAPTVPSGFPRSVASASHALAASAATPATAMHARGPEDAPSTQVSPPPAAARRGRWALWALLALIVVGGLGVVVWLVVAPGGPIDAGDGVATAASPVPVTPTGSGVPSLEPKPFVPVVEPPKPTPSPDPVAGPPPEPNPTGTTPGEPPPEGPPDEAPTRPAGSVRITAQALGNGVPHDAAVAFARRAREAVARCAWLAGPRSFRVTAVFNPEGQLVNAGPDAPVMGVENAECAGAAFESIGPLGAARGGIVFYQVSFD